MKGLRLSLIFLSALSGCFWQVPKPQPYAIPWLGLTMGVPPYFTVTLNAPPRDIDQKGLIWRMEMPTGKGAAVVELFYDLYDEQFFRLEDYLSGRDVLENLTGGGEVRKIDKSAIRISGRKTLHLEIVKKIEDKSGVYDMRYRIVLLTLNGHVLIWRLSVNDLDYLAAAPAFNQFLKAIKLSSPPPSR